MKKILITGCNGQLGRAVQKEYENEAELILTSGTAREGIIGLDISDLDQVMELVSDQKPDVIINCAAHTRVDACEQEWDAAYQINAIGPRNLSIAATSVGAKIIHVSTDYVFAGNGTRPYTEFDEPGPVSAYGKTKLEGEKFVQQFSDRFFILRTAWLYGDGKNFVKTMIGAAQTHDEVNVVCDQVGTPTSAAELARMIHFLEPTDNYGIFHATCEGDTNWADFTEVIYAKKGINCKVNHVTSEEYARMNPAAASRPAYSILDNYMLRLTTKDFAMANWEDALDEYLQNI